MKKPQSLRQLKIVSIAIHFSVLFYVFIVFFLAKSEAWTPVEFTEMLRLEHELLFYILIGLSGVMFLLSLMAPQFIRVADSSRSQPQGIFLDFTNFTPRIFTVTILRLAFAESIAIFGFVLAFLNQSPWFILPFAIVSLIVQILVGPWIKAN